MPAPNLPRRCRQTRLDAEGVTPELLRLKFYYSWTWNLFFSLFLKCLFVFFSVSLSTITLSWYLWFSIFFKFFLSFPFFSFYLGFVSFTIFKLANT
jgi:hypothetical protein